MNRVIDGIGDGMRIGVHVCRGNWTKKEGVLLSGDYTPLVPAFKNMHVSQYVLEYTTERAGDIDVVGGALADREIGLGVLTPRSNEVDSVETIVGRVERALRFFSPQKIFLNPDCGFGSFARRCMADEKTAFEKMRNIARAAEVLRERYA
jgi:5-methyltetrahydropteroyltriglutamate--homocysteine methyltransferase